MFLHLGPPLSLLEESQLSLHAFVVAQPLRVKVAALKRGPHRAAGLGFVLAIPESALCGQGGNILEGGPEFRLVAPELQLAQARGIHQQSAAGNRYQLAPGGYVPSFAHGPAHLAGLLPLYPEQAVDDG